jgi:hypothetical protein
MPDISVFDSIETVDNPESMPLSLYLHEVQTGRWQDQVLQVRAISDKKRRDAMKKSLPGVTFSGIFSKRKDDCLLQHSGVICIDLDDLGEDTEAYKEILIKDRYVYSCFTSVSGNGLRVLFRISGQHHKESYYGISDYLRKNYGVVTDPQSMVPSRSFYVTYDPFLYISPNTVPIFTDYPKETVPKKLENFAFAEDDFFNIIQQIETRKVDLCSSYQDWLKIGFSLSNKFGEEGRDWFHVISAVSQKYNKRQCDKQYSYCLKHKSMNVATISTFYWYCKQAGLQITSERTQQIRKITVTGKSAGLKKDKIIENLSKEGITGEDVPKIVDDVYDTSSGIGPDDSLIDQLETYLTNNYIFKRNEITRYIEQFPTRKPLTQIELNTIWKDTKKVLRMVDYQLFDRIMHSSYVTEYNPLWDYFQELGGEYKGITLPAFKIENQEVESPLIDMLAATIKNEKPSYTKYFLRKWIVGIVSAAFKIHSPLIFVLTGKQNTGKTEWFRRLFPKELEKYYGESKLDSGKDDEILMTQKLLIMDDEFGGKYRSQSEKLKELTSKQWFSLREPYGRSNVDLLRLAVICGTSNKSGVLFDSTGNRRIIPVDVEDIDKKLYNSIDKRLLLKEAYQLFNSGFDWRLISKDDVDYLNEDNSKYWESVEEGELIEKFFSPGEEEWLTATEIKMYLDAKAPKSRLSIDKIGKELKRMNFVQKSVYNSLTKSSAKKWGVDKYEKIPF